MFKLIKDFFLKKPVEVPPAVELRQENAAVQETPAAADVQPARKTTARRTRKTDTKSKT